MPSGILLVLEGIDGSGKSTQAARLARTFGAAGWSVVSTREPTDGPHGQRLRASATAGRLPPTEELELFEKDRAQHVRETIAPALQAGALVVVDRYYFSTAAYQGIRGLDPQEILRRNEAFAPRPDLLVVLDLPVDVALARVHTRGAAQDLFERQHDLARIREVFLGIEGDWVVRVDARQTTRAITEEIVAAVLRGPLQQRCPADLSDLASRPAPDDPAWLADLRERCHPA